MMRGLLKSWWKTGRRYVDKIKQFWYVHITLSFSSEDWPSNRPKSTVRIYLEYREEINPVTRSVMRTIINRRLGFTLLKSGYAHRN